MISRPLTRLSVTISGHWLQIKQPVHHYSVKSFVIDPHISTLLHQSQQGVVWTLCGPHQVSRCGHCTSMPCVLSDTLRIIKIPSIFQSGGLGPAIGSLQYFIDSGVSILYLEALCRHMLAPDPAKTHQWRPNTLWQNPGLIHSNQCSKKIFASRRKIYYWNVDRMPRIDKTMSCRKHRAIGDSFGADLDHYDGNGVTCHECVSWHRAWHVTGVWPQTLTDVCEHS